MPISKGVSVNVRRRLISNSRPATSVPTKFATPKTNNSSVNPSASTFTTFSGAGRM
ncbi:hypothetical protein [Streptomyces chrestomyceticus]|uniref:hypothetical protein n=1 Tax=Streptomyces chrestomyceticus TaxID=68185 RepID=UPI0033EE2CAC